MKTLIVYYSLEGNTDYIAKKIIGKVQADLLRLVPKKEYPTGGFKKYFWGGKSVVFGEKPKLEEYRINLDQYDKIIIGTPIWAGTFTPPIKTFLTENKLENKEIYLFACHAGGGLEKCCQKLKQELGSNCNIVATVDFIDPMAKLDNSNEAKIVDFINKVNASK